MASAFLKCLEAFPDPVLASRAAAGDTGAFTILVQRNLPSLRSFLRRIGAMPDVADDLAQDAMVAAFEHIGDYQGEASFGAWVRKISARLYLRRARIRDRLEPLESAPELASASPDSAGILDLDAALQRLAPVQRLCVSLQHGAGYTSKEISLALGLPEGTVKSHIARGLARLREDLGALS